jgi:hypothetical protein
MPFDHPLDCFIDVDPDREVCLCIELSIPRQAGSTLPFSFAAREADVFLDVRRELLEIVWQTIQLARVQILLIAAFFPFSNES